MRSSEPGTARVFAGMSSPTARAALQPRSVVDCAPNLPVMALPSARAGRGRTYVRLLPDDWDGQALGGGAVAANDGRAAIGSCHAHNRG